MKKIMFVLLALFAFVFMSCDSEPYVVGYVTSAKELSDALSNEKYGKDITIKAGDYTFTDDVYVGREVEISVVEGADANLKFPEGEGLVVTDSLGNGNLSLKGINIEGTLLIQGGGSNSIYIENSNVTKVVLDKTVDKNSNEQLPRLVIKGDTTIKDLEVAKDAIVDVQTEEKTPIANTILEAELTLIGDDEKVLGNITVDEDKKDEFLKVGIIKIGDEYFETFDEALSNAASGDTVTLLDDIIYGAENNPLSSNIVINKNLDIDLNGKIFTTYFDKTDKGGYCYEIRNSNVNIKNGQMNVLSKGPLTASVIFVNHAKCELNNISFKSNVSGFVPNQDSSIIIKNNSKVEAAGFPISTNNTYGTGFNIQIENSEIKAENQYKDNAGVLINNDGYLSIKNSRIEAQRQAVVVRGGTAELENVTLKLNNNAPTSNHNWGDGNEIPSGLLVIGSNKEDSYKADSKVSLAGNIVFDINMAEYKGNEIYIMGRPKYKATLDIQNTTNFNTNVVIGNSKNVTINENNIDAGKYEITNGKVTCSI